MKIAVWALVLAILLGGTPLAFAQDTTNQTDLRSAIGGLRSGSPDYKDMQPQVRYAVREQIDHVAQMLDSLGIIEEISFQETDRGIDIYIVGFRNGRTLWQYARAQDGRIAVLYFSML